MDLYYSVKVIFVPKYVFRHRFIYYVPGIGNQLGTYDAVWGVRIELLTPAPLKCQRADLEVAGQETSERLIEL